MKVFTFRLLGCSAGFLTGCYLFRVPFSLYGVSLCILLTALFYTFVRPLVSFLIMPLNMLLFGIPGLFLDALFILLFAGRFLGFTYWQSFFAAAVTAVCFIPYGKTRQRASYTNLLL